MEGEPQSPNTGRYVSEERHVTSEQEALAEMACSLSSSNVIGDHEDEGSTRREAKLLMSLSAFPQSPNQSDLDLVTSSSECSDCSYMSDSSRSAEPFTFVCPSLSLEEQATTGRSALQKAYRIKQSLARKPDDNLSCKSASPGQLLGRQLKADDREAVRLSADAMALNMHDSFRKALQWRITSWIETLSKVITQKEKDMLAKGATKEDLKSLLSASETRLLMTLRNAGDRIKITGTRTSFTVLPQRADKRGEPLSKKRRIQMPRRPSIEEGEYQYTVAHAMRFLCCIELETPAGFSEITMEVPGTMEGTFLSMGYDKENLTSVSVDVDTEMLAAMLEKCCRVVVRASLESDLMSYPAVPAELKKESSKTVTFASPPVQHTHKASPPSISPALMRPITASTEPKKESTKTVAKAVAFASPQIKRQLTPKTTSSSRTVLHQFSTPPPALNTSTVTAEAVRAALVSPSNETMKHKAFPVSQTRFLSPIPDDFDSFKPRRISPRPRSSVSNFKCNFPSPGTTTNIAPSTPRTIIAGVAPSVLVSPPPSVSNTDSEYDPSVPGPALPMLSGLVEVACRAYRDD